MREKIIEYLGQKFRETRWPNFTTVELTRFLGGVFPREDLNLMIEDGLIMSGEGINSRLIILTQKGQELMLSNPNVNKNN